MKLVRQIGLVVCVLSLSGIVGCGDMGGYSAGGAAAPAAGGTSGGTSSCESGFQETLRSSVNSSLSLDGRLNSLAQSEADSMAAANSSSDLSSFAGKVEGAGFTTYGVGHSTNISTAGAANSFRSNMKDSKYTLVGFGCAKSSTRTYWVGVAAAKP